MELQPSQCSADRLGDDFIGALGVPIHPERKLRRAIEGHYLASVPWHQRAWRWFKGAAKEVNAVPGMTAFLNAGRGAPWD